MGGIYPGGGYFGQYSQGGTVPADFFLPDVSIASTRRVTAQQASRTLTPSQTTESVAAQQTTRNGFD